MSFGAFFSKLFTRVSQWNESGDNVLFYRYPMKHIEVESGGCLTLGDSQFALLVSEGKRIGRSLTCNLGRLTQLEAAESLKQTAQCSGRTEGMGAGTAMTLMGHKSTGRPVGVPAAARAGFCVECGEPLPQDAKFCPECGKQLWIARRAESLCG